MASLGNGKWLIVTESIRAGAVGTHPYSSADAFLHTEERTHIAVSITCSNPQPSLTQNEACGIFSRAFRNLYWKRVLGKWCEVLRAALIWMRSTENFEHIPKKASTRYLPRTW